VRGLLDALPITISQAAERLIELRRRTVALSVLAAGLAATGASVWLAGGDALGISLAVGGAAALGLSALCRADRRLLLLALVAQGDAGSLPEVAALARAVCEMRERARLAGGLRAAAHAGRTGAVSTMMVNPARASAAGPRLLALARALEDPGVAVSAPAAALARRLLSEAAWSPLYNPRLPEADLGRVLSVVERGIASPVPQTATAVPEPACSASSARSTSASSL
jgi:hypothetical protein